MVDRVGDIAYYTCVVHSKFYRLQQTDIERAQPTAAHGEASQAEDDVSVVHDNSVVSRLRDLQLPDETEPRALSNLMQRRDQLRTSIQNEEMATSAASDAINEVDPHLYVSCFYFIVVPKPTKTELCGPHLYRTSVQCTAPQPQR